MTVRASSSRKNGLPSPRRQDGARHVGVQRQLRRDRLDQPRAVGRRERRQRDLRRVRPVHPGRGVAGPVGRHQQQRAPPPDRSASVARNSSDVRSIQCTSSTTITSGRRVAAFRNSRRSASNVRALTASGLSASSAVARRRCRSGAAARRRRPAAGPCSLTVRSMACRISVRRLGVLDAAVRADQIDQRQIRDQAAVRHAAAFEDRRSAPSVARPPAPVRTPAATCPCPARQRR